MRKKTDQVLVESIRKTNKVPKKLTESRKRYLLNDEKVLDRIIAGLTKDLQHL